MKKNIEILLVISVFCLIPISSYDTDKIDFCTDEQYEKCTDKCRSMHEELCRCYNITHEGKSELDCECASNLAMCYKRHTYNIDESKREQSMNNNLNLKFIEESRERTKTETMNNPISQCNDVQKEKCSIKCRQRKEKMCSCIVDNYKKDPDCNCASKPALCFREHSFKIED